MTPSVWNTKRRLVPRWRSLRQTIASRELAADKPTTPGLPTGHFSTAFVEKITRWRLVPNLMTAGELVEAAIIEGEEREAVKAARFLVSERSNATLPLQRLAALTLKRAGCQEDIPAGVEIHAQAEKGIWRRRTRAYPKNALAWVELALFELIRGDKKGALRSMMVALKLAPENRHVIRSASRLFLHLQQPDRAHELLFRNPTTRHDQWLIAAELSIAELAGRKPKFFSEGRKLLSTTDMMPRQITELCGALGTLELVAGRRRKARDYFTQSLTDPTGNALAQAEWASPSFGKELVSLQNLSNIAEAEEANAFHLIRSNNLTDVPATCLSWSDNEPYSIRPFEVGSSISAQLGLFEESLEFTRKGLFIRPNAPLLLNNRAFSLANTGRSSEAETALRGVPQNQDIHWYVSRANLGFIALRNGQIEHGKILYNEAIQGFRKLGAFNNAAVARLYLAREAARAEVPRANEIVKEAREEAEKLKLTNRMHLVEEAEVFLSLPNHKDTSKPKTASR